MQKLKPSFYRQPDVLQVAKSLLGQHLVTIVNGQRTAGMIVETEAYAGATDRASHAYGNRRTKRTGVMFDEGGVAYVYLCYGIHYLFNVVTNVQDIPHAVLVRALQPIEGIDIMLARTRKPALQYSLTNGPGSLCKAMHITTADTGLSLTGDKIFIEKATPIKAQDIMAGTRVGVAYAQEDARLPYRFWIKGNPWVSKGKGL
ncbi:DNA-3-methyladenine glycosylase [Chitinophaga costaii]|uniref:Putative 3-methyladenine DNA glycosylase n=1 Tax=Chitinophaga costaii TaxID=1335309 RepID=A0A1C4G4X3_9BACT|nr:DNA-3-methyladenine glycosylase [Chitinophaga costaii]PUZ22043.1 DNA-3-methyladenine glycosylase [Chitinophaga costaii]SCC63003.1 DNA-3-methyladenine glycosylase [Chitinophaga costaii]